MLRKLASSKSIIRKFTSPPNPPKIHPEANIFEVKEKISRPSKSQIESYGDDMQESFHGLPGPKRHPVVNALGYIVIFSLSLGIVLGYGYPFFSKYLYTPIREYMGQTKDPKKIEKY